MPWNSIWPVGTVSVKQNRTSGQQNTAYIEATMGNSIVGTNAVDTRDHFWNVSANLDGRHRFMQSPVFTSTAVAPNDVYPVLGTGMDGVHFLLNKTATEAPDLQKAEPFHKSYDGTNNQILQMGFRVLCAFTGVASGQPLQAAYKYTHNIKPYNPNSNLAGIQRVSQGIYTLRFTTPLPTNNYIVLGTCMRASATDSALSVAVNGDPSRGVSMGTTFVTLEFASTNDGDNRDPLFAMIAIVGG